MELRADGTVGEVNLVESSNYPILDEAAQRTVKKWTHAPTRRDGVPITRWITHRIAFQLSDGGPGQYGSVRQIQDRLRAAGFDPGPPDGVVGPRTREALRKYQESRGLAVTGELDDATRQALQGN
jgi:TonB family protein